MVKIMTLKMAATAMIVTGMAVATPVAATVVPAQQTLAPASFAAHAINDETNALDYRKYKRNRDYYGNRYDRRSYYQDRNYRGNYRCDKGNGGLAIGAVAGGLAGHEIAGRGDRTLGAILGGAIGAIAGREIDRSNDPCRR